MKRFLLTLAFVSAATLALAKDLSVTMDEQAWSIAIQLWMRSTQAQQAPDWAVTEAALSLKKRVEDAAKAAEKPVDPPKKEDAPK